jgi:uncharacterized membrane protein
MTLTGRAATLVTAALILSVSVNLFGAAAWGTNELKQGSRPSSHGIERVIRSAPEEARAGLRAELEAARPAIREQVGEVREARAAIARLLRDPHADRQALATAFADLRHRHGEVAVLMHDAMIEAMAEMPTEIRGRWAEAWERPR